MKSWQKQQVATNSSAPQTAASDPQQRQAITEPPVVPAPSPWLTVTGARIDLVRPQLEWQGNVFHVDGDVSTQKKKHIPERAYIVNGIIVIEELGIWFPLNQVFIGRKTK